MGINDDPNKRSNIEGVFQVLITINDPKVNDIIRKKILYYMASLLEELLL